MKKVFLSMAVVALIFAASCKKETTVTTGTEGEVVIEEQIVPAENGDFEIAYNEALVKLEEAKKSGDAKAQQVAQEAVDKAKSAWETAKQNAEEIASDVKESAKETGDKIENATEKAKEDAKEEYNGTVDKLKIK